MNVKYNDYASFELIVLVLRSNFVTSTQGYQHPKRVNQNVGVAGNTSKSVKKVKLSEVVN